MATIPTYPMRAKLANSEFGNLQPTLYVGTARGSVRLANAALYKIAADLEMASIGEGWIVQVDRENARIHLELIQGDAAEAQRGMRVLERIARGGELITRSDGRQVEVIVPSRDED